MKTESLLNILKRILGFNSDKPVLSRYDPKIRCSIDSIPYLRSKYIICQSIITNGAKDLNAKERNNWGAICKV